MFQGLHASLFVPRSRSQQALLSRMTFAADKCLTIRSSRARFAVSVTPDRNGRAGLTQALGGI